MLRSLFVAAAIAAVAAPASAQDNMALATQLVDQISPPARSRAQLDAQMKDIRSGAVIRAQLGQNPRFAQEAAKNQPAFNSAIGRIGALQADALGPIRLEMLNASRQEAIAAYARNFTAEELTAILAFYKSPAGTKLAGTQSRINAEVGATMQTKFAQRLMNAEKATAPKIEAELKKLFPAPAK